MMFNKKTKEVKNQMNKNGQMIMINLLLFVMTIAIMIALIPMMNTVLGIVKQSDNLNCPGYDFDKSGSLTDHRLDYNATLSDSTDTLSCTAIALYVPYIILILLVGGVTRVISGGGPQQQQYNY